MERAKIGRVELRDALRAGRDAGAGGRAGGERAQRHHDPAAARDRPRGPGATAAPAPEPAAGGAAAPGAPAGEALGPLPVDQVLQGLAGAEGRHGRGLDAEALPVRGLRPRARRACGVSKFPNPLIATFPPLLSSVAIIPSGAKKSSVISAARARVTSSRLATAPTGPACSPELLVMGRATNIAEPAKAPQGGWRRRRGALHLRPSPSTHAETPDELRDRTPAGSR